MSASEITPSGSPKPEHPVYKNGDIVWTKLGSSWWPGEVKSQDELSSDLNNDFKKPPLVIVKFFDEDSYEYVKNWSHIHPYNCDRKVDFIKKGMAAFRSKASHMEKFPKDVTQAEEKTGGNPNILSESVFLPPRKFNYSELFTPLSPSPKKPKSTSSTRKSYSKPTHLVTHRRFLGHDDYKAYICIQYPGKFRLCDDEESRTPIEEDDGQVMECKSCGFSTKRFNVMMIHAKMHLNSAQKKKLKSTKKRKDVQKKDIFSDLLEEWSDEDQDETKENNTELKDKAKTSAALEKKPPRTYSKKSKKQYLEEKSWEDSDLADFLKKGKSKGKDYSRKKDKSGESSDLSKLSSNTQEDIKNCFDFDEEEEVEDIIVSTAPGRKIPRVIPEKTKSPRTEELQHTLEDDDTDINKDEILKTSQSFNKSTDDKSTDNLEDIFKEVMEETALPPVGRLLSDLKPEQNFHDGRTVKKPDKCGPSETDAGRMASPKKRFVKSFEDFEMEIHSQQTMLKDIDETLKEAESQTASEEPTKKTDSPKVEKESGIETGTLESENTSEIQPSDQESAANIAQSEIDSPADAALEILDVYDKNIRNSKQHQYTEFNIDMQRMTKSKKSKASRKSIHKPVRSSQEDKMSEVNVEVEEVGTGEKKSTKSSENRVDLDENLKSELTNQDNTKKGSEEDIIVSSETPIVSRTSEEQSTTDTPADMPEKSDDSDSDIEISLKKVTNKGLLERKEPGNIPKEIEEPPKSARHRKIDVAKESSGIAQPAEKEQSVTGADEANRKNRRKTRHSERISENEPCFDDSAPSEQVPEKQENQQSKNTEELVGSKQEKYTRRKTRQTESLDKEHQTVSKEENKPDDGKSPKDVKQLEKQAETDTQPQKMQEEAEGTRIEGRKSRRQTRLPVHQVLEHVTGDSQLNDDLPPVTEEVGVGVETRKSRRSTRHFEKVSVDKAGEEQPRSAGEKEHPVQQVLHVTGDSQLTEEILSVAEEGASSTAAKKSRRSTRHSEKECVIENVEKTVDNQPRLAEESCSSSEGNASRRRSRHSERESTVEPAEKIVVEEESHPIEEKSPDVPESTSQSRKSRRHMRHSEKQPQISEEVKQTSDKVQIEHVVDKPQMVEEKSATNNEEKVRRYTRHSAKQLTIEESSMKTQDEAKSSSELVSDTIQVAGGRDSSEEQLIIEQPGDEVPIDNSSQPIIRDSTGGVEASKTEEIPSSEKVAQPIEDKSQTLKEEKIPEHEVMKSRRQTRYSLRESELEAKVILETEKTQLEPQAEHSRSEVIIEQNIDNTQKVTEVPSQSTDENSRITTEAEPLQESQAKQPEVEPAEEQVSTRLQMEMEVVDTELHLETTALAAEVVLTDTQVNLEDHKKPAIDESINQTESKGVVANELGTQLESSNSIPEPFFSDDRNNVLEIESKSPKRGRGRPKQSDLSKDEEHPAFEHNKDIPPPAVAEIESKTPRRGRGRPRFADQHTSRIETSPTEIDIDDKTIESHSAKTGDVGPEIEGDCLTKGEVEAPAQSDAQNVSPIKEKRGRGRPKLSKPNQMTTATDQQSEPSETDVSKSKNILANELESLEDTNQSKLFEEVQERANLLLEGEAEVGDSVSEKKLVKRGRGRPKHAEQKTQEPSSEQGSESDVSKCEEHPPSTPTEEEDSDICFNIPLPLDKTPKRARGRQKLSDQYHIAEIPPHRSQLVAELNTDVSDLQPSATDVTKQPPNDLQLLPAQAAEEDSEILDKIQKPVDKTPKRTRGRLKLTEQPKTPPHQSQSIAASDIDAIELQQGATGVVKPLESKEDEHFDLDTPAKHKRASPRESSSESKKKKSKTEESKPELSITLRERRTRTTYSEEDKILQKVLKESAEEAKKLQAQKARESKEAGKEKEQPEQDKAPCRELRRRTTKVSEEDRIFEKVLRESAEEARVLAEQKAKDNASCDVEKDVKTESMDSNHQNLAEQKAKDNASCDAEKDVKTESMDSYHQNLAEQKAKDDASCDAEKDFKTESMDSNHQNREESSLLPKKRQRKSRWDSGPSNRPQGSPEKPKEIPLGVVIDTKQISSKSKRDENTNNDSKLVYESDKQADISTSVQQKSPVANLEIVAEESPVERADLPVEQQPPTNGDLNSGKNESISEAEETEREQPTNKLELDIEKPLIENEYEVVTKASLLNKIEPSQKQDSIEKSVDMVAEEIQSEKETVSIDALSATSSKSILPEEQTPPEKSNETLIAAEQSNIEAQSIVYDFSFDVSEIPLPPDEPKKSIQEASEIIHLIPLDHIPLPSDPVPPMNVVVLSTEDSKDTKTTKSKTSDDESVLPKKGRWSRRNSHPKKDRKHIEQVSETKDVEMVFNDQKIEETLKHEAFPNTSLNDNEIILPLKKSRRITETNIMLDDDFSFKEDDTPSLLQKNITDALNFIIEDTATPPKKTNENRSIDIDDYIFNPVPAHEEDVKKISELQKGVPPKKKKVDLHVEDSDLEKVSVPTPKLEIPQPPKKKLQKFYENSQVSEKSWTSEMPLMSPLAKKKSFAFQEEQFIMNQEHILDNSLEKSLSAGKFEATKKIDSEFNFTCDKTKLGEIEGAAQSQTSEPQLLVPSTAQVEELVVEEHKVEISEQKMEDIIPRQVVTEHIVSDSPKIDALETSIQEIIPQEAKIEEIQEPQVTIDKALDLNLQTEVVNYETIPAKPQSLLKVESQNFLTIPSSRSTQALDSTSELAKIVEPNKSTDKNKDEPASVKELDFVKPVSDQSKELQTLGTKPKLVVTYSVPSKSKQDTVKSLVKERILTKVNEQENMNDPTTSKISKLPLKSKTEVVKEADKRKFVLKVASAKSGKDVKPVAPLVPEPSDKIEEDHVVMGTKPDVIPDPPIEAEMVEIEENLIQTISQKELADAQVTITPDQVISEKKPTGVTNLLTMANFSESSKSNIEVYDKKSERGTEFSVNAMTKPLDSRIPISKSSTYGRLELLDILEGNSNSNSSTSSNEQFKKSFHKHEPTFIEGIQDFEECIPSSAIVLNKKVVLQQSESSTILESPKLLERLAQSQQKVVIQSDIKVKDSDKVVKITTKPPLVQAKPRIVIKSKPAVVTTAKSPSSKPIILSEQIIRPATLPSAVTSSSQATISTLKRTFEDIEDVEKPFIISKLARSESPKVPEEEIKEVKPRKSRAGKARILQHSVINPQGKLVQSKPATTLPQTLARAHAMVTQPQATISQAKSIKTPTEDAMFDINSMPIVLSDELLTPESIEKMPVVISNDIISTASSSSAQSIAKVSSATTKEKVVPNLSAKKPGVKAAIVSSKATTGSLSVPTPTAHIVANEKSKSRLLGAGTAAPSKLPIAAGLLTTPGSKSAKYLLVSATAQPQQKIVAGVKQTLVGKPAASAIPALQLTKPVQPAVTSDATNGSKIMIVTNQQGEAHRLLLTPAQQKMLGMQGQPVKDTKTVVKGPIPKGLLAEATPGPSGLAPLSPTIGTPQQKVLGTLVATQTVPGVARSGIAVATPRSPRIVPSKRYQGKPGKQKTILIKNQLGQTVKKIQGTDDAELDRQVAEQLAAIKASAMLQAQQAAQEAVVQQRHTTPPTTPTSLKMAAKSTPKRTPPKKVELAKPKLSPPVGSSQPQPQLGSKLIEGVPKMTAAQPLLKKTLETKVVKEEKPAVTLQQSTAPPPTLSKTEASSAQPTNLSMKVEPSGDSKKPDRPLQQLVIQDAMGNQTTITEGQILALPSETVDGQPQSYMLITLDESGNLTPLNNEALMSLDPSLGLGGDISNMVLQVDQGQGILAAASAVANKSDIAAAPIITDQQKVAERIKGPVIEPKELNRPHASESGQNPPLKAPEPTKPVQKPQITPEDIQKSIETEQKLSDEGLQQPHAGDLMPSALESHAMLPELYVSLGDPPNGDPTQGQQLIVTGDPIITQKFLESLTDGTTDLASILTNADGGSLLIQIDGQQILIRTNAAPPLMPSESNEGDGNPIFSPQHKPNQDILAAALANTDVFQGQDSPTSVINKEGLLPPGAELSPNSAGGTLYPMHVSNVLETSLTLSSPIMTPLEAPSLPNKKIADEADILSQVPKNVDLPITITDPNISQTVAHPPASLVELTLPLSEAPCISTATQIIESTRSPSFSYALTRRENSHESVRPSKSSENAAEATQKSFNANMPLLTEDLSDETVAKKEEVSNFEVVGEEKTSGEDLGMTETTTSSTDSLLEAGLCTLGGAMCSSLSEPPPDMFELPLVSEKEEEIASDQSNSVPEAETLSLNSDGSGEIPLQPRIVAELSEIKRLGEDSDSGDTFGAKRAKYD